MISLTRAKGLDRISFFSPKKINESSLIIRFRLFAREDSEHHVNIVGLSETVLKNLETLRLVIDEGLARRHHGKSAFNANSSRSHAVFQLTCKDLHHKANTFRY